jgi:hypothetical protein
MNFFESKNRRGPRPKKLGEKIMGIKGRRGLGKKKFQRKEKTIHRQEKK